MLALFLKELRSFLSSLIGYIVIGVFLIITALFLWVLPNDFNVLDYGYASLDGLFILAPFVFLFLIPAISMRSFADERKSGTDELLYTRPLSISQIIISKYFASLSLSILAILPTLVYLISVYQLAFPVGNVDLGSFWGSFAGLIFLAATFTSIGIFGSSISSNQLLAFVISVLISLFVYMGFEFIYSLEIFGPIDLFIKSLGISHHYSSISRGVIDTRDVVYFLSTIFFFLFLTKFSLSRMKW